MKAAKKGTAINCEGIRSAIDELRRLMSEFDASNPEDVGTRLQAFVSALKRSGLIQEEKEGELERTLLSDIVRVLPTKDFDRYLAEVELFELCTSAYTDPAPASMKEGQASLETFGPVLIKELERMEEECRQARTSSQPAPPPP